MKKKSQKQVKEEFNIIFGNDKDVYGKERYWAGITNGEINVNTPNDNVTQIYMSAKFREEHHALSWWFPRHTGYTKHVKNTYPTKQGICIYKMLTPDDSFDHIPGFQSMGAKIYHNNQERDKAYRDSPEGKKKNKGKSKRHYHKSPINKLIGSYHGRVTKAWKRIKLNKPTNTLDLLGCTGEEFLQHITKQLRHGMTLDNIDIDHIIPLCTGTTEEELIKLLHFSNTQPLPSKVNRRKNGNIWTPEQTEEELIKWSKDPKNY